MMNLSAFIFLLTICSTMTGLITEAIKKMVTVKEPNLVAGIVSVFTAAIVGLGYVILNDIAIDLTVIMAIVVLIIFSWLCAMLGYDKVIQTITQIKGEEN